MSSYHGWTHRSKAQGGTDPIPGPAAGNYLWEIKALPDLKTLAAGDGKFYFMIPPLFDGLNLLTAEAFVSTVSSSGVITVQLNNDTGTPGDMLSTRITIDAGERNSYTAATASVVDAGESLVQAGEQIRVDIDTAGAGAKGLGIVVEFG